MKIHETHDDGSPFFHDIEDPVAFIHRTLNRSQIVFDADERDELVLEGLLVLTKMARAWHSGHEHSRKGTFSGYTAMFLPKRLGDAWHRMHPEHRYVTNPDTLKREWHYDAPAVSLDGIATGGGRYHRAVGEDAADGLDTALARARRIHEFVPVHQARRAPRHHG